MPIVLCSGFSEVLAESRAAALGIRGMMMKPVTLNDLSKGIRDVLDTLPQESTQVELDFGCGEECFRSSSGSCLDNAEVLAYIYE